MRSLRPLFQFACHRPTAGLFPGALFPGALLSGVLFSALLLSGCGGGDADPGDGASLVERFLEEAAVSSGDATPPADLSQPPVPGWTMLQPACPFPLRFQVPPGWDLDEGQTRSNHVALRRDGLEAAGIGISMVGGEVAVADRVREVEANDPSVVRLAEVRYGGVTVPIHGGGDREFVRAYPAVADWGTVLQQAVVELRPARDREGAPLADEETLGRIATTLEPNGC